MNHTKEINHSTCPLCNSTGNDFFKMEFFICPTCSGIFRNKKSLPDTEEEKKRYDLHQNDVSDAGYLQFVSPVTGYVISTIDKNKKGLDYGCGPSSAIHKILSENNYSIRKYDPFYFPEKDIFDSKFNFIICCEVIEHFHQPAQEFEKLKKMLVPDGELLIMTHLFDSSINFENWYYKNDFTHVFFYRNETLEWIKNHFGFGHLSIQDRFIRLKN